MISRDISNFYDDPDGVEHTVDVRVRAEGLHDIAIESELPDMPDAEERGLHERVRDLYFAAERDSYRASQAYQVRD